MLELKKIFKTYTMGDNVVNALRGVSLKIESGDFVAIMGPSGSGKSTLMHILGLLDVPSSGSYQVYGREVSALKEDDLAVLRRSVIGFIFQQFNLLPRMSALENVSLPLLYSKRQLDFVKSKELLEKVGLGPRVLHKPNELSGGQQQRVAIARSLINSPMMILADEPTGNLDSTSEKEILQVLKDLNSQGITVVVVTHEEEVGQQAKRIIRMRDGEIQSDERISSFTPPRESKLSDSYGDHFHMKDILEHLVQGYRTLSANKVRTALSMLGILIGVGAVVAMLALGRGAQKAIEVQLASLGSNRLVLRPGAIRTGGVSLDAGAVTRLTFEDAQSLLQNFSQIKQVSPELGGRAQVVYGDKNWSTKVTATSPGYAEMHAAVPMVGRFIDESDDQKRARVAVLGLTVVKQLFGDKDPIGENFKINRILFQVIGVLPAKGNNGWQDQDDIIIVPLLTGMHRLFGKDYVDEIDFEVADAAQIEPIQDLVKNLMIKRHRVSLSQTEPFQVRNMADIQAALSESSNTMSMLLASIAGISLLVGGIGIMNIMLVSVTERTREIGLRKAVGARRSDILTQFLVESVVVSVIGGLMGIILGWAITEALSILAGWATSISMSSVLLSFFFSATIGVVFGIYPARKASALNPIDALRHE